MAPIRILPLGFAAIILLGTALLMLPCATVGAGTMPFLNALFTATSASCVTGLVVADTGVDFTLFGQIVILVMIQLGGLGFMTMATILFGMTGRRISLHERMTMAEGLGEEHLQGVVRLCRSALIVTFSCELAGAALLAVRFVPLYGPGKGLWFSLFHAISAFCNAGFDLLGGYRSFTGYAGDAYVLLILGALVVIGGLGFAVILDLKKTRKKGFRYLRLHSKLALIGTAGLLVMGTVLFFAIEYTNEKTLGTMPFFEKLVNAGFQSVTLRTAGFNSIDQLALRDSSKGVGILLMLAGGAPAGTAGGLKVTTVMTLFLTVGAYIRGRDETVVLGRTIPKGLVRRALTMLVLGVALLLGLTILFSVVEEGTAAGELGLLNQLYETTSAFCTVGISVGVTGASRGLSRVILILMMFVGRVGLLTVAMALTQRKGGADLLHYPEESVMIG